MYLEDGVVDSKHTTQRKQVVLEDKVVVLLVAWLVSIHEDDIISLASLGKFLKRACSITNVDVQFVLKPSLHEVWPDETLQVWINLETSDLHQATERSRPKLLLALALLLLQTAWNVADSLSNVKTLRKLTLPSAGRASAIARAVVPVNIPTSSTSLAPAILTRDLKKLPSS